MWCNAVWCQRQVAAACRSCGNPGAAVVTLPRAAWLKQGLTAARTAIRPMQQEFVLASVSLQRSTSSDEADSGVQAETLAGAWEVHITQVCTAAVILWSVPHAALHTVYAHLASRSSGGNVFRISVMHQTEDSVRWMPFACCLRSIWMTGRTTMMMRWLAGTC